MASTTLTLPAAMASPAAGTILALDLAHDGRICIALG